MPKTRDPNIVALIEEFRAASDAETAAAQVAQVANERFRRAYDALRDAIFFHHTGDGAFLYRGWLYEATSVSGKDTRVLYATRPTRLIP